MATLDQHNRARAFLKRAQEYLASAEANLAASRYTVAAGDAIHSGICAKDAIAPELTGSTTKAKDHAQAARQLRQALGQRPDAASAEKAPRDLVSLKAEVEYGATLIAAPKAELLVRRAETLVELGTSIVQLQG